MAQPVLRASVVDRLMGIGPSASRQGVSLRELRLAVRRDLAWLLNTRLVESDLPEFVEARRSVLGYGVPDFSIHSWSSQTGMKSVAEWITEAIHTFEPRLQKRSVRVIPKQRQSAAELKLSFRIEGILHVEPIMERVAFDADLDFDSTSIEVEERS